MKSNEVSGILRSIPRYYAMVEITRDRQLYSGIVSKGELGYIICDGNPPTVWMLTGNQIGQVSMPVNNMKFIGYCDIRTQSLLVQDRETARRK